MIERLCLAGVALLFACGVAAGQRVVFQDSFDSHETGLWPLTLTEEGEEEIAYSPDYPPGNEPWLAECVWPGHYLDAQRLYRDEADAADMHVYVDDDIAFGGVGGKSMHLLDGNSSPGYATLFSCKIPTTAYIKLDYYMRSDNENYKGAAVHLMGNDAIWDYTVTFGVQGYIDIPNLKSNLLPYKEKTWYHVVRILDCANKDGTFYVAEVDPVTWQDTSVAEVYEHGPRSDLVTAIDTVWIYTANFQSANAYVDEITITDLSDTTPPEVTCEANPATLWPPNHKMVDVEVVITADDGDGSAPENMTLESVFAFSNEPDDGLGDGDTEGDVDGSAGFPDGVEIPVEFFEYDPELGAWVGTIQLRAERAGDGVGRVYTIVASVADEAGNTGDNSEEPCEVTVEHNQGNGKQKGKK